MNWIVLRKLHEIYENEKTEVIKALKNDSGIRHLLDDTKELVKVGKWIKAGKGFNAYYEKYHKDNYAIYDDFLKRNGFNSSRTRFTEYDFEVLMEMETDMKTGKLKNLRDQIVKAQETVRGVSSMFFEEKSEKYLESKPSLVKAVKYFLNIDELANEKDQQYKYTLECHDAVCIVLCENLDFLKRDIMPRKYHLELWYAGGKNVPKLDYVDTRGLPIYYSADWDYDGLFIIYKLVKEKIPNIKLLYPDSEPRAIHPKDPEATEHKSKWNLTGKEDWNLFNEREQTYIKQLIKEDKWVTEEKNKLLWMLHDAGQKL